VKSIAHEIEQTSLRPDKVRRLVGNMCRPNRTLSDTGS